MSVAVGGVGIAGLTFVVVRVAKRSDDFLQKLLLSVVDKFVLGGVIVLVGYFFQKRLEIFKRDQGLATELAKVRIAAYNRAIAAVNSFDYAGFRVLEEAARSAAETAKKTKATREVADGRVRPDRTVWRRSSELSVQGIPLVHRLVHLQWPHGRGGQYSGLANWPRCARKIRPHFPSLGGRRSDTRGPASALAEATPKSKPARRALPAEEAAAGHVPSQQRQSPPSEGDTLMTRTKLIFPVSQKAGL